MRINPSIHIYNNYVFINICKYCTTHPVSQLYLTTWMYIYAHQFLCISRHETTARTPRSPCLQEVVSGRCSGPLGQFSGAGGDAKTDTKATDLMGKLRQVEIILWALVRRVFAGSVFVWWLVLAELQCGSAPFASSDKGAESPPWLRSSRSLCLKCSREFSFPIKYILIP